MGNSTKVQEHLDHEARAAGESRARRWLYDHQAAAPVGTLPGAPVDRFGSVQSGRGQRYWLPVIGPTAYVALHRLDSVAPMIVDLRAVAGCVGVPPKGTGTLGKDHRLLGALARLVRFGLADIADQDVFRVVDSWPALPGGLRRYLPEELRAELAVLGQ